ncbi:LamG domain-containing protein [Phycisphaeraceae bacterium D3-23]
MNEPRRFDSRDFDALLDAVVEGSASAEQMAVLNDLLRREPCARARYIAYLDLHAFLADPAGPLSGAFDDEPADDRGDILSEVIDQALAERRKHELEEEASRMLAEQQAREAHDQRYLLRRSQPPPREIVVPKAVLWLGLAALIGVVAWLGWPGDEDATDPTALQGGAEVPAVNSTVSNVAVIRNSVGARWAPGVNGSTQHLQAGAEVTLRSGLVEVVFGNGTTVIFEGPVTFEPTGPDGLRLVTGRLSGAAPDGATGFHIDLPEMAVSNHGGDFGVFAGAESGSHAVALAGEITVDTRGDSGAAGGAVTRLSSGSGAVVRAGGLEVVRGDALAFVERDEFEARASSAGGDRYARWLALGYELRRDPDVVAYFVFDQDDAERGVLTNRAAGGGPDGRLGNGAEIAAPRWTAGRFDQTRALRFGDAGNGRTYGVVVPDHSTIDLDDEMTFAIWVRPVNPNRFYGTLLSKRDVPPRRMNYQLAVMHGWHQGGQELQFGAGEDDAAVRGFVYSQASGELADAGWVHIALTTDGRTVRYYINGERVHSARQPLPALTNSADLLIGTSAAGGGQSHFNTAVPFLGDISEVLIAGRAFSSNDIRALYNNSRGGG